MMMMMMKKKIHKNITWDTQWHTVWNKCFSGSLSFKSSRLQCHLKKCLLNTDEQLQLELTAGTHLYWLKTQPNEFRAFDGMNLLWAAFYETTIVVR